MLNKSGVYKITNIVNDKCYIGSAANFKRRWLLHKSQLNLNKHHSKYLQHAWNKYGEENFKFEVLFYCEKEELIVKEQKQLDWFKPEYNICKVAGSCLGIKQSPETIAKRIGKIIDKPRSEETKNKIRIGLMGKSHPPERIAKNSSSKKGIKQTYEQIANRVAKLTGQKRTEEQRARIKESAKNRPLVSEETKNKMSEAAKNKPPMTEETKSKISKSSKNRSEETLAKIGAASKILRALEKELGIGMYSPESIAKRVASRKANRDKCKLAEWMGIA